MFHVGYLMEPWRSQRCVGCDEVEQRRLDGESS